MCAKVELPSDYEPCGECGWDHEYEPAMAVAWHKENPCAYCTYDKGKGAHGENCPTLHTISPHEANRSKRRTLMTHA